MLATVLFIPGSILTLGAGFVFSMAFGLGGGVVLGTVSVFIGASLGAIIAFLLGRYLLQGQVKKLSNKYAIFEALNLALEHNGLKIFLLLRYVIYYIYVTDTRHMSIKMYHFDKILTLYFFCVFLHSIYTYIDFHQLSHLRH